MPKMLSIFGPSLIFFFCASAAQAWKKFTQFNVFFFRLLTKASRNSGAYSLCVLTLALSCSTEARNDNLRWLFVPLLPLHRFLLLFLRISSGEQAEENHLAA